MIVKAVVSYDGTLFYGWQVQGEKRTVQGEIEKALFSLTGKNIRITGSGRTDTGVHALGQVFSFETDEKIEAKRLYKAINAYLPEDIKVLSTEKAKDDFNARFSCKKKTYEYRFYLSETEIPVKERYALKIFDVDIEKMQECVKLFKGYHDFKAFSSSGRTVKSTERTIFDSSLKQFESDLIFTVTGDGFLYNMVRIMAGTLLQVGMGKLPKENVLLSYETGNRNLLGKTLNAKGLTLKSVEYKD